MEGVFTVLQIVSYTILIINGLWTLYERLSAVFGHNQKKL